MASTVSICKAKDHIVPLLRLSAEGLLPHFTQNKRCGPYSGRRVRDHLTTCDVSDSIYSPTTPIHFAGCLIWHQLASLLLLKPIGYLLRLFSGVVHFAATACHVCSFFDWLFHSPLSSHFTFSRRPTPINLYHIVTCLQHLSPSPCSAVSFVNF